LFPKFVPEDAAMYHELRKRGTRRSRAFCTLIMLVLSATLLARPALADDYPSRPVRIIIGFSPGAAADTPARLLAQKFSQRFGQQFIVENRPGATGTIGARSVARSEPDGHTWLVATMAESTAGGRSMCGEKPDRPSDRGAAARLARDDRLAGDDPRRDRDHRSSPRTHRALAPRSRTAARRRCRARTARAGRRSPAAPCCEPRRSPGR